MTRLSVQNLEVRVGEAHLVKDASFDLKSGELVALLGPNGAGKTSLIRAALGLHAASGRAELGGRAIADLSPTERARQIAYLPQIRPLAWPLRVRDAVALGRFAHGGALGRLGEEDRAAVDRALSACDLDALQGRATDTLSGGELARVHCARAFASDAPLLIADEPIAALDPRHQFRVLDVIRSYVDEGGGALVVLHDIALAARYADRLIWMKDGRILADGPVEESLSAGRIAEIYGVRAEVSGRTVSLLRPINPA